VKLGGCKGVKSTLDSSSAVLCDAVKKDYVQFGQQCCRENEGEDIRGSTIEKVCRGNQNRLIDESSVDLTPLRAVVCHLGARKLGVTSAAIAKELGISPSAVSKAIARTSEALDLDHIEKKVLECQ
jgi:DNA-binding CsgD family transcriptional regulator